EQSGALLRADVALGHGVLARSSTLSLSGESLRVSAGQVVSEALGPWALTLGASDHGPGGRAAVTVSRGAAHHVAAATPPLVVEHASASASSSTLDTAAPWALEAAEASIGQMTAPDLSLLAELVPAAKVRLRGGPATATGHVAYSSGEVS